MSVFTKASTSSAAHPPQDKSQSQSLLHPSAAMSLPQISPVLSHPPSSRSSLHDPSHLSHSTLPHSPETLRQIAEARKALEASINNLGSSLDASLRSRVQNLHDNSKQLDKQQKDVMIATEALRKESHKLQKLAEDGSRKVKELGNVQNWAEMLERDFLVLEETLKLANENGSGSERWSGSESSWETDSEGENGNDLRKRGGVIEEQKIASEFDRGNTKLADTEHLEKGKGKTIVEETALANPNMEQRHTRGSSTVTIATTSGASDPSSSPLSINASVSS